VALYSSAQRAAVCAASRRSQRQVQLQPGRERPPARARFLTPRPSRGGRSRPGWEPDLSVSDNSRDLHLPTARCAGDAGRFSSPNHCDSFPQTTVHIHDQAFQEWWIPAVATRMAESQDRPAVPPEL